MLKYFFLYVAACLHFNFHTNCANFGLLVVEFFVEVFFFIILFRKGNFFTVTVDDLLVWKKGQ